MEWENFRRSDNVEDRRDDGGSMDTGGGGSGGAIGGAGGLGLGAVIVLGLIGWALGIDPRVLINGAETVNSARNAGQYSQDRPQRAPPQTGASQDPMNDFVRAILAETEDVWAHVLPDQKGIRYINPKLVSYAGQTRSGCGGAQAAMGPFYCPLDKTIYLDTSFFGDMKRKLGGGGDFAYAYVIAHEVGHHVQDQLGILDKVEAAEQRASKTQANALSVRLELMADCLAGVWAANADKRYHVLQPGDVDKAINTAGAIGDDRLQQQSQGRVVLDSFTHGSSAQRVQWLKTGLQSGQVDSCNTFAR